MVFGFLKRNKQKNDSKSKSSSNETGTPCNVFWQNCIEVDEHGKMFTVPYEDLRNHFRDEDYLKDVVKNDGDIHRKTISIYLLFNFCRYGEKFKNLGGLLESITEELNISKSDHTDIINDYYCMIENVPFKPYFLKGGQGTAILLG